MLFGFVTVCQPDMHCCGTPPFFFCPFLQKNVQSSEILQVRRLACIISHSQVSKIAKYTRKPCGRAGVARGFGSVERVTATTI